MAHLPLGQPDRPRRPGRVSGILMGAAVLLIVVGLAGALLYVTREDQHPTVQPSVTAATGQLPPACADAIALARLMAGHVGPLAQAVNDHTDLMERLDLFLEGKPGGLSGRQVYERGQAQMEVFEKHGPDAEVQVRRFQEVAKRCPLK